MAAKAKLNLKKKKSSASFLLEEQTEENPYRYLWGKQTKPTKWVLLAKNWDGRWHPTERIELYHDPRSHFPPDVSFFRELSLKEAFLLVL